MLLLKPHAKGIYEPPGISCQSIGLAKKFYLGSSITSQEKSQKNFLTNPIVSWVGQQCLKARLFEIKKKNRQ